MPQLRSSVFAAVIASEMLVGCHYEDPSAGPAQTATDSEEDVISTERVYGDGTAHMLPQAESQDAEAQDVESTGGEPRTDVPPEDPVSASDE